MNKVILMGNLGKAPETRTLESGVVMCRFPIATSETYKNRKSGEKTSHTEWHNIVVRNKAAEICNKYLKKGDKVYVEGKLKTRKWQGEDGIQRYSTEVHVNEFNFLNNKSDADAPMSPINSENSQTQTTSDDTQNQVDDLPF